MLVFSSNSEESGPFINPIQLYNQSLYRFQQVTVGSSSHFHNDKY